MGARSHRRSYEEDPGLVQGVLGLLRVVFGEGFARAESAARVFGTRWEACSTPFVVEEGGAVIGHVGVLEIPVVVRGRPVVMAGIHGVAVHPDHRGRGLSTTLLEEAAAFAREDHEIVSLTTLVPRVFEKVGFRSIEEHRVVVTPARPVEPVSGTDLPRALDPVGSADNRALAHRLLGSRVPLSDHLAVGIESDVFRFNLGLGGISHAPAIDALLHVDTEETPGGTTLRIHDVVPASLPTLPDLIAATGVAADRVEFYLAIDRVPDDPTLPARIEPHRLEEGADHLMALEEIDAGGPFMLPFSVRC